MGVRLVALDIDGTIVTGNGDHDGLPPDSIREAVRLLSSRGVEVILASGRMFPGTAKVHRFLGLQTPMVCQQGCGVHLPDGGLLHQFAIERQIALEIIAHARELGHDCEWFSPLRYVASRETRATQDYGLVSGITPEYRTDPENSDFDPTGVGIISSAEDASEVHRGLVHHYGDRLHVLDFPTVTVAVAPEANKGHALSLLCADLGIDRHDVLAIGDSVNDAPMLAWAGRGVAMPHSDRYAMSAADEVLAEDGPEAVAAFLLEVADQLTAARTVAMSSSRKAATGRRRPGN